LGYLLGIALSHIGMEVMAGAMKESYRYTFSGFVFLREELILLAGALGIGFVAAIIPAIQASRTDISTTLSEG
jgi:putative ABC transport system permease protein